MKTALKYYSRFIATIYLVVGLACDAPAYSKAVLLNPHLACMAHEADAPEDALSSKSLSSIRICARETSDSDLSAPRNRPAQNGPREGRLRVSDSGHYFTYRGKDIMLVGDSGTQCVMQDLNIDYRAWIDDLSDRGINAAHIWALLAPRQTTDGSQVETRYGYRYPGATPWKPIVDLPTPAGQFARWDLTAFDEGENPGKHYWPRLRDLAAYSQRKGVFLGVTLFFGWPKHDTETRNDWAIHPFNRTNGGHLDSRYETMQIHTPGTEVLQEPWSEAWPDPKKTQWIWERYAQKMIDELGAYDHVFFVYKDERSYDDGPWQDNMDAHMRAFFRHRGTFLLTDWDAVRGDIDILMVATHRTEKNELAREAFTRTPPRPVMLLESPPYTLGDPAVRLSMWSFAMGGGHFIFHDDAEQGTPTTGVMGYDPNVVAGIKPLKTYDWLGHLCQFFNRYVPSLDAMTPHNELTIGGNAYCLAYPGAAYVCYLPEGGALALDVSSSKGALSVSSYNPATGVMLDISRKVEREGGVLHLEMPSQDDCVVLIQEAK